MSTIEALFIFDEHNTPLLEHICNGRPASSSTLLPLYLAHPAPRPSLIYLPSTNPATLLYSLAQDQLLFLAPCSSDTDPLQVLEFLHRLADVLEDYLGAPLLASKIEANYHVVAQLLNEMVDGGIISCTEPDALRDLVDAPSLIKSLLGNVGLPSTTPSSLAPSSTPFSLGRGGGGGGGGGPSPRLGPSNTAPSTSPVPWRRANVRHTSNEMYVDIVETLAVTLSPSGRPLSAIASGTIAFTAKVSGVPDLLLHLACPGGVSSAISLPVFHPCVRLGRWTARPGELSFVPPDGRFVLAAYEVDLLGPAALDAFTTAAKQTLPALNIPATVSVTASLGPRGDAFQVRLQLNPRFTGKSSAPPAPARGGFGSRIAAGAGAAGTSTAPAIEDMTVHIPLPASVANILDLRVARGMGDASYAPGAAGIEWRISAREVAVLMAQDRGGGVGCHALLSGTVVGSTTDEEGVTGYDDAVVSTTTYDYNDDDGAGSYQSAAAAGPATMASPRNSDALDEKRRTANKMLMPSAATVSFSVKGWLPSGLKVESLNLDVRKSRGLGGGVTPYKGVKYLCVSRKGVECRC